MKAFTIKDKGLITAFEIAEPVVGPTDVLLEVCFLGLCGSDLNSYRGLMPLVVFPRIPGHEVSGIIIDKGLDVPETINIGDRVTVSPYTNCGICPACRQGRINTCEFNQTLGIQREGALTQLIAVPFQKVYTSKLLSLQELVLVEPFSVGYHAANRGNVFEKDIVLLLGCGSIGLGALCAAVRKGATVIALDIDDSKLVQAKKFGALYTINSAKEAAGEVLMKITQNEGVSIVIEVAGTQETYKLALDAVCFAGRIVFIGYPKQEINFDAPLMVRKEVNIYGSRNALGVFPSVIDMFEQKEKPYTDIITKIFSFNETPEAFSYWDKNAGTVSKLLIDIKN